MHSMHGNKNMCMFKESMHYDIHTYMHSMHGTKNMCIFNKSMHYAIHAFYARY